MKIIEKTTKIFMVDGERFYTKDKAENHIFNCNLQEKKKLVEDYLVSLYAGNGGNETMCSIKDQMFISQEQAYLIRQFADTIIEHKASIPNLKKLLSEIELIGKHDE